jgi:hypothetical protein
MSTFSNFNTVTGEATFESRIGEFDRPAASQVEIQTIAANTAQFLSGLAFTLRNGFPQEKLAALRQCIDRIRVDKPADEALIAIRKIPAGNLDATQEIRITLAVALRVFDVQPE